MSRVENPHFAWPFRRSVDGSTVVEVQQDTPNEIRACQEVIARCPVGWRWARPEFGWRFPTFRNVPLDPSELAEALARWEPRAIPTVTESADILGAAYRDLHSETEVGDAA